jgi:DNA invertase Pin-like site-specific DNA recombinase
MPKAQIQHHLGQNSLTASSDTGLGEIMCLKKILDSCSGRNIVEVATIRGASKNLYELRDTIGQALEKGISVRFLEESLLFDDIHGQSFQILNSLCEFQSFSIKESQRKGIEKARKMGKYKGRPKSIPPEQYKELIWMRDSLGMTYQEIAQKIGKDRQTVSRAFRDIRELQRKGKDPRTGDLFNAH